MLGGCTGGSGSKAEVGDDAPAFSTFDLNDKPVRLEDFRGQKVVLNFWASWCTPCRKEFPILAEADRRAGVTVLGVVFKDTVANAKKFMSEHQGTWPGLQDDGKIAKAYRVGPGIPATIVIGPEGVVLRRNLGEVKSLADLSLG
jgi:peroxiredoxin